MADYFLPLLLDGPMQSWGCASRFQRRATERYPTKSGVIGLICAAMGLEKGSVEERRILPCLAGLVMQAILLPRPKRWIRQLQLSERSHWLEMRRLEDYHTVGGGYDPATSAEWLPRTASGHPDKDATVSRRQYLLDARFGMILEGAPDLLAEVTSALLNPVWGIWLGRKSCIPSAPVLAGEPFPSRKQAWKALLGAVDLPLETLEESFDHVEEVATPAEAQCAITDKPVSFGDGRSSGPDVRHFAVRYVCYVPGRPMSTR